jgi:glycosyltransferase involved in cell wall biosynthesis
MAWNWCVNLAKHCELFIITEEEFRDKIEAVISTLPQGRNMHFYFNRVTPEVRKMCWNQGDWRFYWYYRQWQKRTLILARQICAEHKIDILHQLNMIGYREPGLLWKIKGPKYVWGPVGGMETMPIAYLKGGIKTVLFNCLKNLINSLQYRYQPNVRYAVKRADVIIAATSGCQKKLQDYYGKKVYLINETGCEVVEKFKDSRNNGSGIMSLLWVGKLDFRKQVSLAIDVLGELNDLNVVLHVCGGGSPAQIQQMKDQSMALGVERNLKYHGLMSHDKIQLLMQSSDLFLFTSIMEGTPHVVQEAISNHLPVICLDTCGQGDCVKEEWGRKVPLSNPEASVSEMAKVIRELYYDRTELKRLSENCLVASQKMSWDSKILQMFDIYCAIVK